jgi:hypothetical protein
VSVLQRIHWHRIVMDEVRTRGAPNQWGSGAVGQWGSGAVGQWDTAPRVC